MIVIFQDHSKQVYDQLYESKSGFCGFEQIPKDLMYKGEILQMQYQNPINLVMTKKKMKEQDVDYVSFLKIYISGVAK